MHTKGGNIVGATSDTSLKPLQKVFLGSRDQQLTVTSFSRDSLLRPRLKAAFIAIAARRVSHLVESYAPVECAGANCYIASEKTNGHFKIAGSEGWMISCMPSRARLTWHA